MFIENLYSIKNMMSTKSGPSRNLESIGPVTKKRVSKKRYELSKTWNENAY